MGKKSSTPYSLQLIANKNISCDGFPASGDGGDGIMAIIFASVKQLALPRFF